MRGKRGRGGGRKDLQLSGQAKEALELALAEIAAEDDALESAWVAAVHPDPDASQLLVVVEVESEEAVAPAREALEDYASDLRHEVAEEISRRRAPELRFQVVLRGTVHGR
ncbi:MAG: ribosome-binding factor A [Myxococcota bacterium]